MTSSAGEETRLTYQNNEPVFSYDRFYGHRLEITFGGCFFDDVEFFHSRYKIDLRYKKLRRGGNPGWVATMRMDMCTKSEFVDQGPKVLELVQVLNNAIRDRQELDLSGFEEYWMNQDQGFYWIVWEDHVTKIRFRRRY